MTAALKIVVAEDHPLMLDGIRAALAQSEDIEIVGEARAGSEVLPLVHQLHPDLVLLDMRLPLMDGLTCLELIRRRHPGVKVVMLSVFNDQEHIERALRRGASGYIVKSINPADLPSAIRQAYEGTVFHALGLPEDGEAPARRAGLTEREASILRGVAKGLSNGAIGRELWVTEQTVKFHLTNIFRKLSVANRTEAAAAAYRLGIVDVPDGVSELSEVR
jgi:DNA-binding NarL/FixJ family response regulator